MDLQEKQSRLQEILESLGKVVVAYSGGVDSTFLLKAAVDTLGAENVLAVIASGMTLPGSQYERAIEIAKDIGAAVETIETDEMADAKFVANKADRCFHCKSHLFGELFDLAKKKGYENVIYGANVEDFADYRPGHRAAEAFGAKAPLAEAGLTKAEIRELSRRLGLPTADIPASPCLASRIAYGLEVTAERLEQIEKAEEFLRVFGLVEFRVRHHGDIARIEVHREDFEKVLTDAVQKRIVERLKSLGFKYITLDLQGFRSGSLNEALDLDSRPKAQRSKR
jgi:uncharacterized protein